jgi:hypothetical protein
VALDGGRITASRAASATQHHPIHIRGSRARIAATQPPQIQFGEQAGEEGGGRDQSPAHSPPTHNSAAAAAGRKKKKRRRQRQRSRNQQPRRRTLSFRRSLSSPESGHPMMPPRTQRESERGSRELRRGRWWGVVAVAW